MTDFDALDALYPLPPKELSRQWLLTEDETNIPPEWETRSAGGWHLAVHPDTSLTTLVAKTGEPIGWVVQPLAYLGADEDLVPAAELVLPVTANPDGPTVESALYGRTGEGWSDGSGFQTGNWTAIVIGSDGQFGRIYLGSIHSIVYSARHRIVATSHNLIPGLRRDRELSRAFDPLATKAYYTFGLTAFRDLERLHPNHFLELRSFGAVRHWPKTSFGPRLQPEEAAAIMVDQGRRALAAVGPAYEQLKVPLSAGRDSRAVLACLGPGCEVDARKIILFTSYAPKYPFRMDTQIAVRLSKIARLPHRVQRRGKSAIDDKAVRREFVKIGEAKYGRIMGGRTAEAPGRDCRTLTLPGMAGETARAFFWDSDIPAEISAKYLVERIGSPPLPRVIAAAEHWYAVFRQEFGDARLTF